MRFEEIPYNQVIASAKMFLNLENTTDHDPFFLLMADEAMRKINDRSMFEFKTQDVTVDSGTAPLPCGFMQIMAAWFSNQDGRCTYAPYVERSIVDFCGCDTTNCGSLGNSYQINGNYIVFHNPDAMSADEVTLAYLSIRLDENNQPVMYERHERAVRAYILWRALSKFARAEKQAGLRQSMMKDAIINQREWGLQKTDLRATAVLEGWKEDKVNISRTYNAWIGQAERGLTGTYRQR